MPKRRQAVIAAVIVLVGLSATLLIPGVRRLLVSTNTDQAFALMNKDRVTVGHELPMVHQAQLDAYAQNWSNHMLATGVLVHDTIQNHICCWDALGENVGEGTTLVLIEQAFMNSPEHRANILYPTFTQVGIGVAYDSVHNVYFVTQAFRDPSGTSTPTPRKTVFQTTAPTVRPTRTRASPTPTFTIARPKPKPSVTPTPSLTPTPTALVIVPSPIVTVQAQIIRHRSTARVVLAILFILLAVGALAWLIRNMRGGR